MVKMGGYTSTDKMFEYLRSSPCLQYLLRHTAHSCSATFSADCYFPFISMLIGCVHELSCFKVYCSTDAKIEQCAMINDPNRNTTPT